MAESSNTPRTGESNAKACGCTRTQSCRFCYCPRGNYHIGAPPDAPPECQECVAGDLRVEVNKLRTDLDAWRRVSRDAATGKMNAIALTRENDSLRAKVATLEAMAANSERRCANAEIERDEARAALAKACPCPRCGRSDLRVEHFEEHAKGCRLKPSLHERAQASEAKLAKATEALEYLLGMHNGPPDGVGNWGRGFELARTALAAIRGPRWCECGDSIVDQSEANCLPCRTEPKP